MIVNPEENCIACCNRHTNSPEVLELQPDRDLSKIGEEYRLDQASPEEGFVSYALETQVRLA